MTTTVDRVEYIMWCDGCLLHFDNGKGCAVKEPECLAADEALERGERVLLREGGKLTGTYCILEDGCVVEKEATE